MVAEGKKKVRKTKKLIIIAGPCVIEDKHRTLESALFLKEVTSRFPVDFIFKASFDKANRTSYDSFRGPGLKKGIKILETVRKKVKVPILSDVHCTYQIPYVKDILDVIQIPAFLSRQTDLLIAAARTQKTINVKKAQFMGPGDMKYVIEKITSTGNKDIFLTERGTCLGYNNLVVDFRSLLIMKEYGFPVIYDVTHSLQRPSAQKGISGGDREFILPMALAGICCNCDGLFLEVHPYPPRALCDRATSFYLSRIEMLIKKAVVIKEALDEKSKR